MRCFPRWLAPAMLTLALWVGLPGQASAIDLNDVDVSDKNYLTFVLFLDFFNSDCFHFDDEDQFTGSYGLFIGDYTYESETILLLFSINYVEVKLLSATEATFSLITAFDNSVMVGSIETDDGDGGFFFGIESRICAYPARLPAQQLTPMPDPFVPAR